MKVKSLTLLAIVSLCIGTGTIYGQSNAALPNAPQLVAADLTEFPPLPPDPSSQTASLQSAWPQLPVKPLVQAVQPFPPKVKVMDKKFIALGVLTFGLTAMDVEFTQYCLHRHTCVELNPTLPTSHWGMYAVNTPVNMAVMYFSYRRRAAGKWGWWVAPAVDIGAHAVGIGSNVRFLGK